MIKGIGLIPNWEKENTALVVNDPCLSGGKSPLHGRKQTIFRPALARELAAWPI